MKILLSWLFVALIALIVFYTIKPKNQYGYMYIEHNGSQVTKMEFREWKNIDILSSCMTLQPERKQKW